MITYLFINFDSKKLLVFLFLKNNDNQVRYFILITKNVKLVKFQESKIYVNENDTLYAWYTSSFNFKAIVLINPVSGCFLITSVITFVNVFHSVRVISEFPCWDMLIEWRSGLILAGLLECYSKK